MTQLPSLLPTGFIASPKTDGTRRPASVGHLRHKPEVDPARPRRIITEPGIGYRLRVRV
jgi:DNA-binding response OmpR family regulator